MPLLYGRTDCEFLMGPSLRDTDDKGNVSFKPVETEDDFEEISRHLSKATQKNFWTTYIWMKELTLRLKMLP